MARIGHARAGLVFGTRVGPLLLLASIGLWIFSIHQARQAPVNTYGLIPMLGPAFIVALALAVGTAMWALPERLGLVSGLALTMVVLFLNGTPALVADQTLSSWNYKHFGIVDYIVSGAPLNNQLDVFQQWPGFFAAGAALVELTGVPPLDYANWAQFFFEALNALTVFALARRLAPSSKEVAHLTVLMFVTSAWVGQRYYAPQSLAFLMWLLFIYFALPMTDPSRTRFRLLWERRRSGLRAKYSPPSWLGNPEFAGQRGRSDFVVPGLTLMFVAITITHQLTPYMVMATLVGLWIMGVLPAPLPHGQLRGRPCVVVLVAPRGDHQPALAVPVPVRQRHRRLVWARPLHSRSWPARWPGVLE